MQTNQDGALASAMDMAATIRTITHGGDRWVIGAAAGIPTTGGARGAERPWLTFTEFGAIRRTRGQERLGQIPTREIMVRRPAADTTTAKPAGARSRDAATTLTSTRVTQQVIAAEQP